MTRHARPVLELRRRRARADDRRTSSSCAPAPSACAIPWTLGTFPPRDSKPDRFRLLVYTCAGGNGEARTSDGTQAFVPLAERQRLLRRALSFQPQAVIANGDHVYWDLLAGPSARILMSTRDRGQARRQGVQPRAAGARHRERGAARSRGVAADRRPLRHPAALDAGLLPAGRPRLLRERPRRRHHRHVPARPVHARARRARRRSSTTPSSCPTPIARPGSAAPARRIARRVSPRRSARCATATARALLWDCRRYHHAGGADRRLHAARDRAWLLAPHGGADERRAHRGAACRRRRWAGARASGASGIPTCSRRAASSAPPRRSPTGRKDGTASTIACSKPPSRWIASRLFVSGDLHALGVGRILRSGSLNLRSNPITTVLAGPLGTGPVGWASVVPRHRAVGADRHRDRRAPAPDREERLHVDRLDHRGCDHPALLLEAGRGPGCDRPARAVSYHRGVSARVTPAFVVPRARRCGQ